MKRTILCLVALTLAATACKKEEKNNPPGGSGGNCASDANICFRLGDTTRSFKGTWHSLLGGGRGFEYSDSGQDFNLDVGTGDVRSFQLSSGSLWSGGARMTYYNRGSNKQYKAYRGTVTITSNASNTFTGTFEGAAQNSANAQDTLLLQNGKLTAVPQK